MCKLDIMPGGLDGIICRGLRRSFATCRAMLSGLTKWLIACCTFILAHQPSPTIMKWLKPLTDTSRGSAHVRPSWPYPLAGRRARRRPLPPPEARMIAIHVDGEQFLLTYQNSAVYRFRTNPFMDHAHYAEASAAFYIFGREDLLEKMEAQGYTVIIQQVAPDSDIDAYLNWQDSNTDWST